MQRLALLSLFFLSACSAPNPSQPADSLEPAAGNFYEEPSQFGQPPFGEPGVSEVEPDSKQPDSPRATVGKGCKVGGCSAQLCVDANSPDLASTCEWTQAYTCYQSATCEKQSDGQCGWTKTNKLEACLQDASVYRP